MKMFQITHEINLPVTLDYYEHQWDRNEYIFQGNHFEKV